MNRLSLCCLVFLLAAAPVLAAEESGLSGITAGPVIKCGMGHKFTEGPVWHKDGYFLFSDIPENHVKLWRRDNPVTVWRADSGKSNGLTFDREGRLIACEHGNRRVSRTEKDGQITVIADSYKGKKLNSPNDCTVRSDGTIYFTDPSYGLEGRAQEQPGHGVYRVKPGEAPVLLAEDFNQPNGIALSPDEKTLYVCDSEGGQVRKFKINADDSLGGGDVIYKVGTPDGMKVDVQGRLFIASEEGISVLDENGMRLGIIEVPDQPANCAFGDEDNQTLFITARTSLYLVRMTTPGIKVWK